ncbi:MAG: hypothetical protein NTX45_04465 [Proteobacteria bacterium]|nr:hypothetical protein [Pseudomonadota bacterium]
MITSTISIEVDAKAAQTFFNAPEEEKHKLQLLMSLRLQELTVGLTRNLSEIMDEMGAYSETQGMTPDILESLLREK